MNREYVICKSKNILSNKYLLRKWKLNLRLKRGGYDNSVGCSVGMVVIMMARKLNSNPGPSSISYFTVVSVCLRDPPFSNQSLNLPACAFHISSYHFSKHFAKNQHHQINAQKSLLIFNRLFTIFHVFKI